MVERSLISVVDDDESVRESLPDLIRSSGLPLQAFASAEEFLDSDCVDETRCLLLDIAMPGMSGPDLQRELLRRRTGDPDRLHHRARRRDDPSAAACAGAVECLFKPFSEAALLDALNAALRTR